jgi:hypothetical protein
MWGIGKASRRRRDVPCRFARATEGGFPNACGLGLSGRPMLVDGACAFRCAASLRHPLLAENLGKPSLWVIIKDLWYWA